MLPMILILFQLLNAWSFQAHCIIGLLAMRKSNTDLDLCRLSVLPDKLKYTKEYAWTRKLHYTDITDTNCNVTAANNTKGLIDSIRFGVPIQNKTVEYALKIHLIQDVHQPLHLSGKYRGGNEKYFLWNNKNLSLHHIWDFEMVNKRLEQFHSQTEFIDYLHFKGLKSKFTIQEISSLNCNNVYNYNFGTESDLSGTYYSERIDLVENLLISAALQISEVPFNFNFQ